MTNPLSYLSLLVIIIVCMLAKWFYDNVKKIKHLSSSSEELIPLSTIQQKQTSEDENNQPESPTKKKKKISWNKVRQQRLLLVSPTGEETAYDTVASVTAGHSWIHKIPKT